MEYSFQILKHGIFKISRQVLFAVFTWAWIHGKITAGPIALEKEPTYSCKRGTASTNYPATKAPAV
jgi:hypothetical protein